MSSTWLELGCSPFSKPGAADGDNDENEENESEAAVIPGPCSDAPTKQKNDDQNLTSFNLQSAVLPSTEDDGAGDVTVWVPTEFTTAAGRPICIRERRRIDASSPYWWLLRECPPGSTPPYAKQYETEEGTNNEDEEDTENNKRKEMKEHRVNVAPPPVWSRRPREENALSSMPNVVRRQSYPTGDVVPEFTFAYSSFTTANGRMIYLSG